MSGSSCCAEVTRMGDFGTADRKVMSLQGRRLGTDDARRLPTGRRAAPPEPSRLRFASPRQVVPEYRLPAGRVVLVAPNVIFLHDEGRRIQDENRIGIVDAHALRRLLLDDRGVTVAAATFLFDSVETRHTPPNRAVWWGRVYRVGRSRCVLPRAFPQAVAQQRTGQ